MRTSSVVAIIVAILIIGGLAWYVSSGPSSGTQQVSLTPTSTDTTSSSTASSTTTATPAALAVSSNGTLGSFLVAANGMTLYMYSPDKPDKSNCTGQCAVNWPPYTVAAGTDLGMLANATGALGTVTRADGSLQVTYNHQPLYFYIKDKNPGDTTGQGVGGVWYVLKP
jgi:predicted lipoprotein with Yx(FWY)xxD motif